MKAPTKKMQWDRPNVVGTLHSAAGWAAAGRAAVDAVEVRVDSLPCPPTVERVGGLRAPAIVTVRDPDEGGVRALPVSERQGLYLELLSAASAVDIEARNLDKLEAVVAAADGQGAPVIASMHDFAGVPALGRLQRAASDARRRGARVVKIAATPKDAADLVRLLRVFECIEPPLAVMGMGRLGRASRLACAACGSCLNYGWLAAPQVPGQWPAIELRRLIAAIAG